MAHDNWDLPAIEQAVDLLQHYFLCRTDRIAFLADWQKPQPAKVNGQIEALLRSHVAGRDAGKVSLHYHNRQGDGVATGPFRIGAYTPAPDGTTRWLCLDFDGGKHPGALANPKAATLGVYRAFHQADIAAYLEQSGSGEGWHLWVFFSPPMSAKKARALAYALMPAEVTLASREQIKTDAGRGIEVFPKRNQIKEGGYGNAVWLPWWWRAKPPANQFHRLDDTGDVVPYVPAEFQTADPEKVEAVIVAARVEAREQRRRVKQQKASTAWQEWREKALVALRLEDVYQELLTGRTCNGGWLECRDPWSPTADQDPSAGVADGSGEAERGQFHSFISGESISVFDFLIKRGLATDFNTACEQVADLSGVPLPAGSSAARRADSGLPRIQISDRQLSEIADAAWAALHARNTPPQVFVRSSELLRLREDEKTGLRIESMSEDALYGRLARVADWFTEKNQKVTNTFPPREVAKNMLAYPDEKLPILEAVVNAPVFGRDGKLILEPGYHESERLWYHPCPGMEGLTVSECPSPEEIAEAGSLFFDDLLVDFPLEADCDRAHAVAAFLQPFIRRRIGGPTPLYAVTAPVEGSGKGLLCNLISIVATGTVCAAGTLPEEEAETRKLITAELKKGDSIILFDNARKGRTVASSALEAVLTTEIWIDRELGASRTLTLPNRVLWLLTGNNIQFSGELARRHVRIRITPSVEYAWRRKRFKHKAIISWAKENRARLVWAALTLIQAWIAAGEPLQEEIRLGSFEAWSEVMGGILQATGIPGFLGHLGDLYETADAESGEWREFVGAWREAFGQEPKKVAELNELCEQRDLMDDSRGDGNLKSQQTRLGQALQGARDRIYGGWRIVWVPQLTRHKGGKRYALEPVEPEPELYLESEE